MGSNCCYSSDINPIEDEELGSSLVLDIISIKITNPLSPGETVFNENFLDAQEYFESISSCAM